VIGLNNTATPASFVCPGSPSEHSTPHAVSSHSPDGTLEHGVGFESRSLHAATPVADLTRCFVMCAPIADRLQNAKAMLVSSLQLLDRKLRTQDDASKSTQAAWAVDRPASHALGRPTRFTPRHKSTGSGGGGQGKGRTIAADYQLFHTPIDSPASIDHG